MTDKKILIDCQYLPPVSYFALCLHASEVYIEQHEYFVKSSNRNRCYIASPNGLQMLSIPIHYGKSHKQLYKDVQASKEIAWQKNHWQSLCSAYRSSPFFEFYEDEFYSFFHQEVSSVFEYNMNLFNKICSLLKIEIPIKYTESFKTNYEELLDYRFLYREMKYEPDMPEYTQVFGNRHGFLEDISILDLLFNMGPSAKTYLQDLENHLEFPMSH
jgi:hypothetical protein